jgi:AraC-like DNA-binding protein/ligand-binding sensor protein
MARFYCSGGLSEHGTGETAVPFQLLAGGVPVSRSRPATATGTAPQGGMVAATGSRKQPNGPADPFSLIITSPAYCAFAPAYQTVTRLALRAVPALPRGPDPLGVGGPRLELCRLLCPLPNGRKGCCASAYEGLTRAISERVTLEKRVCSAVCAAGLRELAATVFIGPSHVATLVAGPACVEPRDASVREKIESALGKPGSREAERLMRAYAAIPVMNSQRFHAAGQLLEFFARTLEECLPVWQLASSQPVPLAVLKARDYLAQHASESVTLGAVARHAGLGVQRFCAVFKTATGLTFTHFLARLRVQRAKSLLPDVSRRIADIAFGCGFGSVPTFNRTFKGLVGTPPAEYRRALRAEAKF